MNDAVLRSKIVRTLQDHTGLDFAALAAVADEIMANVEQRDLAEVAAPVMEKALRNGIKRNLLKLAEGRRVYKASLEVPPEGVKRKDWLLPPALQTTVTHLEIQAEDFELAARVVMKGEDAMYSLPSWMWTQEMIDKLYTKSTVEAGD